jgi:hypothetical protein
MGGSAGGSGLYGLPGAASPAGGGGSAGVDLFNGASGTIKFPLQIDTFFADQMIFPNAAWAIPAGAPTDADNTSSLRAIIGYPAAPEQGRGVSVFVPTGATSVRIWRVYKAATAPAGARTAGSKMYWTTAAEGIAVPAFQSAVNPDFNLPADTTPQVDFYDKTLDALPGVTGDVEVYFEFTRIAPTAGVDLVGNLNVSMYRLEWYKPGSPP